MTQTQKKMTQHKKNCNMCTHVRALHAKMCTLHRKTAQNVTLRVTFWGVADTLRGGSR